MDFFNTLEAARKALFFCIRALEKFVIGPLRELPLQPQDAGPLPEFGDEKAHEHTHVGVQVPVLGYD